MFKFKLIEGSHTEGSESYKKGAIIETKKNLAKAFPGRFLITKDVINVDNSGEKISPEALKALRSKAKELGVANTHNMKEETLLIKIAEKEKEG